METPRSESYNDIYFCEEDGLAEGDHVFLKGNGLPGNWENKATFTIAETGFGTGLNFLAAWLKWDRTAEPGQTLTYISFEKYPLSKSQIEDALSRWRGELGGRLEKMLGVYPARIGGWHQISVTPAVRLLLIFDDVNRALPELSASVDAWFLDGFAPAKNPEMWSETVFGAMAKNSHGDTTFASFTAAGLVKNGLRAAGFHVAKSRGFGRKRDMIYGRFLGANKRTQPKKISSVAVIGGGLAGTAAAAKMLSLGARVDLYEARDIASGASGNARGLFNPRFTARRNAVSDFYASAYALALRAFEDLPGIGYQKNGSLHLLTDADKAKRLQGSAGEWGWHADHMRLIDAAQATAIAGVGVAADALYLPQAGSVNPAALCAALAQGSEIKTVPGLQKAGLKNFDFSVYDAVILAAGPGSLDIDIFKDIPLHTVRGQIAFAPRTDVSAGLAANICYGGYVSAAADGMHALGSTFQPWLENTDVRAEDNDAILASLHRHAPALAAGLTVTGARAALRTASRDRFPVVGHVRDNIYVSTAHGSHGIVSSLLSADILAALVAGGTLPVPASVLAELSPKRFADRAARNAEHLRPRAHRL